MHPRGFEACVRAGRVEGGKRTREGLCDWVWKVEQVLQGRRGVVERAEDGGEREGLSIHTLDHDAYTLETHARSRHAMHI